jgi:hypothetical protein
MFTNVSTRRRRATRLAIVGAGLAIAAVAGAGVAMAGSDAPAKAKRVPVAGTQNLGSYTTVTSSTITVPPGTVRSALALCPSTMKVLGGGEGNSSGSGSVVLTDSDPAFGNDWEVYVKNTGTTTETFNAYAVCGT